MNLLNFSQKYETELIELWNRCMIHDQISILKFRKQVLYDENFESSLCLLAVEGEQLIGFILGMKRKFPYLERGLEPERGWINLLFVKKECRRQGIARAMVQEIEQRLKTFGVKHVTLAAYSPNYFFPGIDVEGYPEAIQFFEQMGYQGIEDSFSMCKDLHDYYMTEDVLEKKKKAEENGFWFGNFEAQDALEILELAKEEFGGGWKRNLLMAMRAGEAEDVVTVVKYQGRIVGFAMRKIDGNPMRFGPIGVSHKMRNFGIGGILFEVKQQEMCSKGIYHLFFVSTDIPGRRFYERHGVQVFRTYRKYEKNF